MTEELKGYVWCVNIIMVSDGFEAALGGKDRGCGVFGELTGVDMWDSVGRN